MRAPRCGCERPCAGEFFTTPEVVDTLVRILEPSPGDTVYDPTAGSGGMLVHVADFLRERGSTRTEVGDYDRIKKQLLGEAEKFFRPEVINRLDDIIVFRPLVKDDLTQIIEIELSKLRQRLPENDMKLVLDAPAREFLIDKGYNPDFGARPLAARSAPSSRTRSPRTCCWATTVPATRSTRPARKARST